MGNRDAHIVEADLIDAGILPGGQPPIGRRSLIAAMAGLGLAGALGASTFAQEATPQADDETDDDPEAEMGEAYQNFVGKLATNLGIMDSAEVDTAIREALKAMVDEKFAEGEISRNLADELKEQIDSSEVPFAPMLIAGAGSRRLERRRNRRKDRRDDEESDGSSTAPESAAVSTTPVEHSPARYWM